MCQLLPGYGVGTSYTWGMGKGEAGKQARNTFLTWGQKNIHSMSFRSPRNGVMKKLVQRKYLEKRQIYPCVLISSSCQVRTMFRHQLKCNANILTQSIMILETTLLYYRETFFCKITRSYSLNHVF